MALIFLSRDLDEPRMPPCSYNIIVVDNTSKEKKPTLLKIYNHLGQEVDENHKGFLIYYYDDGSTKKVIKQ